MKKTKLTIALMGSMAVTSAFATTGTEVNASLVKYSNTSLDNATTNPDSIIKRTTTLVNTLVNDTAVQKHLVNSLVAEKTVGLKTKAANYKSAADEKLKNKKNKLADRQTVAAETKGFAKINAWKDVLSSKIEVEKQRGRVRAARNAINELAKFVNDGFFNDTVAQANGIRVTLKNGLNDYNNQLVNPSKDMLSNAWSAATKFNYVDYTANIHSFWDTRMNVWSDASDLTKDAQAFNELTNVATIEAIAQIKGQDTAASIKDYANANELAFQVTTLGNSEQVVKDLVNSPTANLYLLCSNNAQAIVNNSAVKNAVDTINQLQNKEEIATVIDAVLAKVGIDSDYTIANINSILPNIPGKKLILDAISNAIGNAGSISVDADYNLKVDITGLAAQPLADAIAGNSIYKEVVASQNLVVGSDVCNYDAVSTSTTRVGQAMMAATNYYANAIAKESGTPVDAATKSKVLMALEANLYANINKIK